jgi:ferredoxin-thioredoxin reductase catalytic chain
MVARERDRNDLREVSMPTNESRKRIDKLVESFTKKSGTTTHPDSSVTEAVVVGLANHVDELGKPLCPCRFYPDKQEEVQHRTWICPCDDMQIYKYCHCLLFVDEEGRPITEYLPEDHEGRQIHGIVADPTPDLGRALRDKADERERERKQRPS